MGRRLSPEDLALWDGVTRSVRPLRKRVRASETRAETADPSAAPLKAPKRSTPVPKAPAPVRKPAPPLAPLDRKTKQKLARGRDAIDARLDLHGHTQAEAHDALLRFLQKTQARGDRMVLVITGKGSRNPGVRGETAGGALKRAVPLWLALPEFRRLVAGFDSAAIPHGGEGALYVRLRKSRPASS